MSIMSPLLAGATKLFHTSYSKLIFETSGHRRKKVHLVFEVVPFKDLSIPTVDKNWLLPALCKQSGRLNQNFKFSAISDLTTARQ